MTLRYFIRRDADGALVAEGEEDGPNATLAAVQARQPAGRTVLDAATKPRPPSPAPQPHPLKAKYALALTPDAKLDVIAESLGLK